MNKELFKMLSDRLDTLDKSEIYEIKEALETDLIFAEGEAMSEIVETIWGIERYLDESDWSERVEGC